MAQHKTTPWRVECVPGRPDFPQVIGNDDLIVAAIYTESFSDARLIAAAPDLLHALETLIADIDSARSLNEFIIGERANRLEGARALVAEIEGGA